LRHRWHERGRDLELLDLRVPDRERLRLSAMIDVVRGALGPNDRAIAIGSSLGGLTMARTAEREARIVATLLIAPAFRIVERWRRRLGEHDWETWRAKGTMAYDDHTTKGGKLNVDFGLMIDAENVDEQPGKLWPDVRVPTTVVQGQRDETVDPELARTFAATRKNVRLVETDDDHSMLASLDVIDAELERLIESL
jgi:pimeloyl-ACP methyl ester carboxylesterase